MRSTSLALLVVTLAGCSGGSAGPAGPAGEKGAQGEQGIAGKATPIPTLTLASSHVVLGAYLGGVTAFSEKAGGEVNFAAPVSTVFESVDCSGAAHITSSSAGSGRSSARFIGPGGAVLRPTGRREMVTVLSSLSPSQDCAPLTSPPQTLVTVEDTGITLQFYKPDELAVEMR